MSGIGLHPLTSHQPQRLQTAEQRIHCSLRYDQVGIALQPPQNRQPVKFAVPQRSQNRKFKASFAELNFPLVSARWVASAGMLHVLYNALQGMLLSIVKRAFRSLLGFIVW